MYQADLTFNTRTGKSVTAYYGRGTNFDSDLVRFGGRIDLKVTDALSAAYNLTRVNFDPDPADRSSWIHYVRATYYVNKDMFFKLFYQSKFDLTGSFGDPHYDTEGETTQFVYVWRFSRRSGQFNSLISRDLPKSAMYRVNTARSLRNFRGRSE